MDVERARTLVAGERRRIEAALAGLTGDEQADESSRDDQAGEAAEAGTDIQHEMTDQALTAGLEAELAAVVRAEARLADGTYGLSRRQRCTHPGRPPRSRAARRTHGRGAGPLRAGGAVGDRAAGARSVARYSA